MGESAEQLWHRASEVSIIKSKEKKKENLEGFFPWISRKIQFSKKIINFKDKDREETKTIIIAFKIVVLRLKYKSQYDKIFAKSGRKLRINVLFKEKTEKVIVKIISLNNVGYHIVVMKYIIEEQLLSQDHSIR